MVEHGKGILKQALGDKPVGIRCRNRVRSQLPGLPQRIIHRAIVDKQRHRDPMFAVVAENDVDVARRIDRRDRDRQIAARRRIARARWHDGCLAWNGRPSTSR